MELTVVDPFHILKSMPSKNNHPPSPLLHIKQSVDKDLLPISVLVWNVIVVTDLVRVVWSILLYLFVYLGEAGIKKKKTL